MTNLEKLKKKYPPQVDMELINKKIRFNSLLKEIKRLEKAEPFDEKEHSKVLNTAHALYSEIASVEAVPEGAAVKGFKI